MNIAITSDLLFYTNINQKITKTSKKSQQIGF